jgi:hypothetical protein
MNAPLSNEDMAAVDEAIKRLETALSGLPPLVQLDALFNTYMKVGKAHGELEKVGTFLLELGGSIVFSEMLAQSQRPARTTAPAPGRADYPPAPNTRQ